MQYYDNLLKYNKFFNFNSTMHCASASQGANVKSKAFSNWKGNYKISHLSNLNMQISIPTVLIPDLAEFTSAASTLSP